MSYLEKLLEGAEVAWFPLGDERLFEVANNARRPVKASLRSSGVVPYYGANNIQDYVDGFTHEGEYVLIAEDGSASLENYSIQYAVGKFWANNHVHVVRGKSGVNTKFLYHYLRKVDFLPFLPNKDRSKLTKGEMVKIPVPIPCPENPKKSVEIQTEIVRILDAFTELTTKLIAELAVELAARKKQYKYYRDRLFTFSDGEVDWKPLGEIVKTIAAPTKLKREAYLQEGEIPIVDQGASYIAGYTNRDVESLARDEYVVFGDHTEHIKYIDFAFVQGADGLKILKPVSGVPKYFYYALQNFYQKELNYKRHWSRAAETLIPIPYPNDIKKSRAEQGRIVAVLDKFDALNTSLQDCLPREIELRQKQFEYYRDQLLNFPTPIGAAA